MALGHARSLELLQLVHCLGEPEAQGSLWLEQCWGKPEAWGPLVLCWGLPEARSHCILPADEDCREARAADIDRGVVWARHQVCHASQKPEAMWASLALLQLWRLSLWVPTWTLGPWRPAQCGFYCNGFSIWTSLLTSWFPLSRQSPCCAPGLEEG